MKRIDEYVNNIYKGFDAKDPETQILIEETASHLYDEVEDLKSQGFSEEESIKKAIFNFGKEKSVVNELKGILKKQNKFSKIVLRIAFIIFCIGAVFKFLSFGYEFTDDMDRKWQKYTADNSCSRYVFNNVREKLAGKESMDDDLKDEITQILDEFNDRTNNGMYSVSLLKDSEYVYEYDREIKENEEKSQTGALISGDGGWKIQYSNTKSLSSYDDDIMDKIHGTYRKLNLLNSFGRQLVVLSWIIACMAFLYKIYMESKIKIFQVAYFFITSISLVYFNMTEYNSLDNIVVFIVVALFIISTIYNKKYIGN